MPTKSVPKPLSSNQNPKCRNSNTENDPPKTNTSLVISYLGFNTLYTLIKLNKNAIVYDFEPGYASRFIPIS